MTVMRSSCHNAVPSNTFGWTMMLLVVIVETVVGHEAGGHVTYSYSTKWSVRTGNRFLQRHGHIKRGRYVKGFEGNGLLDRRIPSAYVRGFAGHKVLRIDPFTGQSLPNAYTDHMSVNANGQTVAASTNNDLGLDISTTTRDTKRNGKIGLDKRHFVSTGKDRLPVSPYQLRKYPYSNVVRLSSGCTGTLLTPSHVMTAAHCVHDGTAFRNNVEMLKVEVPDKIGYRIHYVVKINVPTAWLRTRSLPQSSRGAFDYAVLRLNLPVRGRKRFMQLTIPDRRSINSNLAFLGFRSGRGVKMWTSGCSAGNRLLAMRGNVLLGECDSAAGNSGAAIFVGNARKGQKIIGVLSNVISGSAYPVSSDPGVPSTARYSSIMLLTLPKCLDICAMILPDGEEYEVCSEVKKYRQQYLRAGSNRILPYFG